tara:strand:+ start:388 stop:492 length:105 start_codon:yes stop_codon:yes gene_type:complete
MEKGGTAYKDKVWGIDQKPCSEVLLEHSEDQRYG